MPIFQNSVVTKQLQSQDKTKLLAQWNVFTAHFHNPIIQDNIRSSKEEQYQGEFLIDLFVKVLGYTKNPTPNFSITTEYKNVKDSKKADGAILINDKVKAVIELKGTNTTDLNKIEVQAFGYKNNQPDCVYVITSNFEKLRFYIDNATEHLEFNLFNLTEKEFQLLYLCLAYENIANDIPKKLKEQSVSQEKDITKALYTDYSLFKRELHHDLVKQNPQFDALELFQKSQKLLDRFLFIFFAEDRNLLPTNLIFRINKEWRQLQEMRMNISLYDRYKIYFNDLNKGAKVTSHAFSETVTLQKEEHQIFAYNGGLFQPDEVLEHIRIDDELLYKYTHKLSNYDFASEVDVNILGHIFENSLNELDEIKAQLEGGIVEKTTTKRKKDGVFYTPKYITKYIVDNTVGKLCMDKKAEINIVEEDYVFNKGFKPLAKKQLFEKLTTYRNWLLQLTICDPACGSGAFLNQALDFLISEHKYIDELQAKLFGDALVLSDVEKSILENNLYGVDLNEESVEIAKLSLWLRTAQPNRKLNDLNSNIKCGNSLIDDVAIAGEKAFNWQKAFPQVFKEKQKKPWHITTAIHDSRTSQRMVDYKVREKRALGTMPEPQINYLTDDDEAVIAQTVAILGKEQNLNILAFNVCKDHIHIVLVCEEDEVNEIVRKIKGRTAREVNLSKGFKPLVKEKAEKSIPLWTQKFGCKEITDENQLANTLHYIKTNRVKHNLPDNENKGFKPLVDSISCSHEHAFREEYKGGFDVIIGNPPYGAKISKTELNVIINKFDDFGISTNLSDTYFSFYALCLKILLAENGYLGFITPNTWRLIESAKKFRNTISEKPFWISQIIQHNEKVFSDATVDCDTLIIKKDNTISNVLISITNENGVFLQHLISQSVLSNQDSYNLFLTKIHYDLKDKINQKSTLIKDEFIIKNGVKPYEKGKGKPAQTAQILLEKPYTSLTKKDESFSPLIGGSSFHRYNLFSENINWIQYGEWLAAPREKSIFENKEKLIFRQTSDSIIGSLISEGYIIRNNTHIILNKEYSKFSLKYIISILNSKLVNWYYWTINPEKGEAMAEVKAFHLGMLPFIDLSNEKQQPFIEKADVMLTLNKELQILAQKFQRTIQRKFELTMGLNPLPKKLQDWYLLSYADFIKELTKLKIKLTLSQEAEWEEYFIAEATKVNAIKNQITATDKAIDTMVYELYGLSKEEIEIVENS